MQGKRAEAPAVAALARWPTSRRLPDLSRGQPAAREASYFKARRTAPRNLVCFCEREKKKIWAEMSWMQIPRPPAGHRRGRGRMLSITVRLGVGGLLIGRAQGLLLSACVVLCTASALHCTALLTCKRECFKRSVHKQCSNGRNWHDHNTERYLHSQRQIPNFLTAAGTSVSSSQSFLFLPSPRGGIYSLPFISRVSIGRLKASASVRPRPCCCQTVKSQPRSSPPDEVPDFDGAPHCGRTREMNDNLKRSPGSPDLCLWPPLFLLPLDTLPVFWLELVPDLAVGRFES